jgi:hypothetical protein
MDQPGPTVVLFTAPARVSTDLSSDITISRLATLCGDLATRIDRLTNFESPVLVITDVADPMWGGTIADLDPVLMDASVVVPVLSDRDPSDADTLRRMARLREVHERDPRQAVALRIGMPAFGTVGWEYPATTITMADSILADDVARETFAARIAEILNDRSAAATSPFRAWSWGSALFVIAVGVFALLLLMVELVKDDEGSASGSATTTTTALPGASGGTDSDSTAVASGGPPPPAQPQGDWMQREPYASHMAQNLTCSVGEWYVQWISLTYQQIGLNDAGITALIAAVPDLQIVDTATSCAGFKDPYDRIIMVSGPYPSRTNAATRCNAQPRQCFPTRPDS